MMRGVDMLEKGNTFPTGYGMYEIIEIKNNTVYAVKTNHAHNSIDDFNVLQFTTAEVENYIKYQ